MRRQFGAEASVQRLYVKVDVMVGCNECPLKPIGATRSRLRGSESSKKVKWCRVCLDMPAYMAGPVVRLCPFGPRWAHRNGGKEMRSSTLCLRLVQIA